VSTHCIIGHWPWKAPGGAPSRTKVARGRFVHYDGYPRVIVTALLQSYIELGTVAAVRKYAIRPEETGNWHVFVPPGLKVQMDAVPALVPCGPEQCDQTGIRHMSDPERDIVCNYCEGKADPKTGLHMRHNFGKTNTWEAALDTGGLIELGTGLDAYAYSLDSTGIRVYSDMHGSESYTPWSIDPARYMGIPEGELV
jgi:hypothetical protein